ncbi:MAG: YeeE/YedE thiosulfate transporter family protein [Candidatus Sericytochromatia bacterium]|nr:YeeE/YedE thiosulfate transporter family protein [Candidatus Sericytochromatia bacterium]
MNSVWAALVGIAMGWLIHEVGASDPRRLLANLRLEQFDVIRFMALSIAVAAALIPLLGLAVPLHTAIKSLPWLGVVAGGLVFGVGFGLVGFCPGTCIVAAGSGRREAWAVIAGGVAGALLYHLTSPWLAGLWQAWDAGRLVLPDLMGLPSWATGGLLAVLLLVAVRLLPERPAAQGG